MNIGVEKWIEWILLRSTWMYWVLGNFWQVLGSINYCKMLITKASFNLTLAKNILSTATTIRHTLKKNKTKCSKCSSCCVAWKHHSGNTIFKGIKISRSHTWQTKTKYVKWFTLLTSFKKYLHKLNHWQNKPFSIFIFHLSCMAFGILISKQSQSYNSFN